MKLTKQTCQNIIGYKNYFHQEINQRKSCIKKLGKYVTAFDYIDKILTVLSVTTGGVSIISFTSVVGAPVGIASAIFILISSLTTGRNNQKITTLNKKQKKSIIRFLCWLRVNSIAFKISPEKLNAIIREKKKYERMKENEKNISEKQENTRLNSVNSKIQKKTRL